MSTFVSIGNSANDFSRLLNEVKRIAHLLPQPVIVQHGRTPFSAENIQHFGFVDAEQFQVFLKECTVFITHGCGGSVFSAIRLGKKAVVVPRRGHLKEVVDDHQVTFGTELAKLGQIELVLDTNDLKFAVQRATNNPSLPDLKAAGSSAKAVVAVLLKKYIKSQHDHIMLVTPPGGHLLEIFYFKELYKDNPHEFVLHTPIVEPDEMKGRTSIISFSERDWKFLLNLFEAWKLLRKHKSKVILTSGGGFSVAFTIVGLLMGIKTVYIETWAKVDVPTATGRIMYKLTPHFLYQWPQLEKHFPKATCIGLLI